MTQYRIITNGSQYRIEQKCLFGVWRLVHEPWGYDYEKPVSFPSQEAAQAWIDQQQAGDVQSQPEKWRVVE